MIHLLIILALTTGGEARIHRWLPADEPVSCSQWASSVVGELSTPHRGYTFTCTEVHK